MSDLAPPEVVHTTRHFLAVRLVVEDGLPYRLASWHLWRSSCFVPYATIKTDRGIGKKAEQNEDAYLDWGPTFPATLLPTNS
jgi:hypothetical protein